MLCTCVCLLLEVIIQDDEHLHPAPSQEVGISDLGLCRQYRILPMVPMELLPATCIVAHPTGSCLDTLHRIDVQSRHD